MSVREKGWEWACNWCKKKVSSKTKVLPHGWNEPGKEAYLVYEPEHLCPDCPELLRAADELAYVLRNQVEDLVRKCYEKASMEQIPDPDHRGIHVQLMGEEAPSLAEQQDDS